MAVKAPISPGLKQVAPLRETSNTCHVPAKSQPDFELSWAGLVDPEDGYPETVIGAPEEREWR